MTDGHNDINGVQKAACVFMNLGEEVAASVARHLTQAEMERIAASVISAVPIDDETSGRVAEEFIAAIADMRLQPDGVEFVRNVVAASLGKEKAAATMSRIMKAVAPDAVAIIRRATTGAIVDALRGERAQVAALTLTQIDFTRAVAVIEALPQSFCAEIILRLYGLTRVPGRALREIAAYLEPSAGRGLVNDDGVTSATAGVDVDGIRVAAGLVARLGAGAAEIMERIESLNPEAAAALKEKMRQG